LIVSAEKNDEPLHRLLVGLEQEEGIVRLARLFIYVFSCIYMYDFDPTHAR
jgi:hypothetical protein